MNITLEWQDPIKLIRSQHPGKIYDDSFLSDISEEYGIYIFSRVYGGKYTPIYIGKSINLRGRLKSQMNNLKLISQVKDWHPNPNKVEAKKIINGKRVLLVGHVKAASAASKEKAITLAEKGLIEHALSNGTRLLNIQGTLIKYHEIYSENWPKMDGFEQEYLYLRRSK
ncbi:hypothetical protein [Castellaniella denitrificans]|uniref:hypothetical protein n=1 Tax=Castellaniella denitrificans TaxID=56119 RepID=UPI0036196B84